ncbi:MAG: hypothetical protein CVV41_10135 [Candidatus Riflebacteria bacterium HGW-Riflebacteria-1]|jgi:rubrerythrin|nr:MAG: hypothetical protein CVV41_10135 [Candidatus Riflebacteria bacterium HGW-Riflebacteria-1]
MSKVQELLDLIDAFTANELALAGYYELCAEKFPQESEQWKRLMAEEEMHAQVFRKIRKSVEEKPEMWKIGRFTIQTVNLICKSVKDKTEELKRGSINPKYAINFIADVEQSLIEGNISKSLDTEVEEFRALLNRVQEDTTGHKQLLLSLRK